MYKRRKVSLWLIFWCVLLLEAAIGIYMSVVRDYYVPDALSRVSNAFYVLFSREAHLAAIGFIWNPLPSLLTIPFVSVWPIMPEWVAKGVPGVMISSIFAAVTSVLIFYNMHRRKFPLSQSLPICIVFTLHPYIFMYGMNGMSETMFAFFLIVCTISFTDWMDEGGGAKDIILVGLGLAFAFLTRYEAVPFGIALTIGLILYVIKFEEQKSRLHRLHKGESLLIILLLPAVLSGLVWMFLNYMIVGDALYFFRSNYSNLAQVDSTITTVFTQMIDNPAQTMWFIIERSLVFIIPYVFIIGLRILNRSLFRIDFLILTMLAFSVPMLQFVLLMQGSSYGWLRYFYYPLFIAVAWFPYELRKSAAKFRKYAVRGMVVSIVISAVLTVFVMNNARLAPDEYSYFRFNETDLYKETQTTDQIATYLNEVLKDNPDMLVMMDSFRGYNFIMKVKYMDQLVITSDSDFKHMLESPTSSEVTHMLIPKPEGVAVLDRVNQEYPLLYEGGEIWADLVMDFDDLWRLYQIRK